MVERIIRLNNVVVPRRCFLIIVLHVNLVNVVIVVIVCWSWSFPNQTHRESKLLRHALGED